MSSIQNDLLSGDTWRIFFLKLILFNVCGISNLSTTWFTTAHGYMEMGHISLTRLRVAWEHSSASHPGWGRHSGSIAHAETRKSDSNQLVTVWMNMLLLSCTATSPVLQCWLTTDYNIHTSTLFMLQNRYKHIVNDMISIYIWVQNLLIL